MSGEPEDRRLRTEAGWERRAARNEREGGIAGLIVLASLGAWFCVCFPISSLSIGLIPSHRLCGRADEFSYQQKELLRLCLEKPRKLLPLRFPLYDQFSRNTGLAI